MNTVDVLLRVRPGKRDEFLQTIKSLLNELKVEGDLSKSSLYEDSDDSLSFHLVEDWETQDSMERYIRSERFSLFMSLLHEHFSNEQLPQI